MTTDIAGLRFIAEADVYKGGILAGRLRRTREGGVEFSYTTSYVAADGTPIASSLPTVSEPLVARGIPPFFAGLLPEGHRLTVLRNAVKTSPDDELTVLLAVGSDLPGDVQVVPSGSVPQEPPAVAELDGAPLDFTVLAGVLDLHGLPGVQDKVSASMLTAPLAARGGRYILKLDPPEHRHLVLNEALHLEGAKAMRLPVANAEVITDDSGRPGLLVRRFDRVGNGAGWGRLPLEDGAQVLGVLPAAKYGVSTEEVVVALANVCTARPIALRNLYMQVLFAWLTGNGDLHAKNLAVLGDGTGKTAVAPIFDIPCTILYGDETLALPVGGDTRRIKASHWATLAQEIGLPAKAARSAAQAALQAANAIDLNRLPFTGTHVYRAQRELRARREALGAL